VSTGLGTKGSKKSFDMFVCADMRTIHKYLFAYFSLLYICVRYVYIVQKVQGSSAIAVKETSGPSNSVSD